MVPRLAAIPAILIGKVLRQLLGCWRGHRPNLALPVLVVSPGVFPKRDVSRVSPPLPNYIGVKHNPRCAALEVSMIEKARWHTCPAETAVPRRGRHLVPGRPSPRPCWTATQPARTGGLPARRSAHRRPGSERYLSRQPGMPPGCAGRATGRLPPRRPDPRPLCTSARRSSRRPRRRALGSGRDGLNGEALADARCDSTAACVLVTGRIRVRPGGQLEMDQRRAEGLLPCGVPGDRGSWQAQGRAAELIGGSQHEYVRLRRRCCGQG